MFKIYDDLFADTNSDYAKFELFKLFYLFFRKEAFTTTEYRPHKTFLEVALEEGKKWEEAVSENLKEKVFLNIFP